MQKLFWGFLIAVVFNLACSGGDERNGGPNKLPADIQMDKAVLKDKIKGGWAGQTIGVTYGGPTEFQYKGTFIQDYQPLDWYPGYVKETMIDVPGLYDDIYMDLTFVDVIERMGVDAPVDSFASAFAHADYKLWHANQAARYNILHGMKAPETGHWMNNPHADDIDYQIEADYAGLMHPGMPNAASKLSDKIGHIMCYGDGWYGGVYVGAMYSLAFVSDDIHFVVSEALKTIPAGSKFHQVITDVINWHDQYPRDWHQSWFELQKKWSDDLHCPGGVFQAFDIDATINSAYVVMGLLYGNGDFGKTLDIATRAGQDSDCNPSTAGGILGTLLGYEKIPAKWRDGLAGAEEVNFKYTTMSLNKVYETSFKHALEMIQKNGGAVTESNVTIKLQRPEAVRLEQSFDLLYPVAHLSVDQDSLGGASFEFEGTGFVLSGAALKEGRSLDKILEATLFIDGKEVETVAFPTDFTRRRLELFWNYKLAMGKHEVKIVPKNLGAGYRFKYTNCVVYNNQSDRR